MSKTLEAVMAKINKGQGWHIQMWSNNFEKVGKTSSWVLWLDLALGWWWAEGRIIEIFWGESSGKTTLAIHAIAEAQSKGKVCAFIDMELSMDFEYAEKLGLDQSALLYAQPDNWEAAIDTIVALAESWEVWLIVVDSVANLTPKAEIEWETWAAMVGKLAKMMAQAMRKITGPAGKNKCTVMFINQTRQMIGKMFGDDTITPGGKALQFAVSQRVKVHRKAAKSSQIKWDDGELIWSDVTCTVIKNKVAPPFKEAQFDILYWQGVDKVTDVLNVAKIYWIYEGRWIMNGQKIANNHADVIQYYKDNVDKLEELKEIVVNTIESI